MNSGPGSGQRVCSERGPHLRPPAQSSQWWERKGAGACSSLTASAETSLPSCAVIPLGEACSSPFTAREELSTLRLSVKGRACGHASLCLAARGQCRAAAPRAGALAGVCGMGRCFTRCDTPPVKVKGSLMFSEMLFKAAPSVLLAQLRKQRALGSPPPLSP